jgi:hypothetical protein
MASLASGLFNIFEGDPTQGEQQGLGSLAGFENNTGEGAVNAGLGFENSILSGDPTKIAQVEAPEIRAGQDQIQQQAEQNAFFGNRGGGGNSAVNSAQSNERGNIINLTGQLQQGAAGAELGAGENLLGQGSSNLNSEANLAVQNNQRLTSDVGNIAQGAASIASPFLGAPSSPNSEFSAPQLTDLSPEMGAAPANFNAGDLSGLSPSGGPDLSVFNAMQPNQANANY